MSEGPRIAALFPGQGSHAVGMGVDLTRHFPHAEEVYATKEAQDLRCVLTYAPALPPDISLGFIPNRWAVLHQLQ